MPEAVFADAHLIGFVVRIERRRNVCVGLHVGLENCFEAIGKSAASPIGHQSQTNVMDRNRNDLSSRGARRDASRGIPKRRPKMNLSMSGKRVPTTGALGSTATGARVRQRQ